MAVDVKLVGERLKAAREAKGLKQKDAAAKINEAEPMTAPLLSKYENGGALVPLDKLIALADLYEVSLDELIGREKPLVKEEIKPFTLADVAKIFCELFDSFQARAGTFIERTSDDEYYVNAVVIENKQLEKFIADRNTLSKLVHSKTIDRDMLESWQEQKFRDLESSYISYCIGSLDELPF